MTSVKSRNFIYLGYNDSNGFEPDLPPENDQIPEVSDEFLVSDHPRPVDHVDEASFERRYPDTNSLNETLSENEDLLISTAMPHAIYNPSGSNTVYTIFLIVNAALGAGLLNFPKAFDDAGGILVATVVQGILIVFIVAALIILAYSSDKSGSSTIQETVEGASGRTGRILTSLCVVVYCFGTTITFLIIIADQWDRALKSLYGSDFCNHWYMSRTFTMVTTAVVCILPMCYSRKIDFLKLPSALGVVAILYLVALIFKEYFTGNFVPGPIKHHPDAWTDVFYVVPEVCFGYQCHVSVIPIYSCMKHRTLKQFTISASSAIAVCLICYTFAATFGYLTFGSFINEDIMLSYDANKPEIMVGIVALTLKTITTYPILLFCGREAAKSLIREALMFFKGQRIVEPNDVAENSPPPEEEPLQDGTKLEVIIRVLIVTLWFCSSLILAVKIPNIGQVIRLLGSLAAIFIFVFPGVCLFQFTFRSDPAFVRMASVFRMISSFFFLAIGMFMFGVIFTQSIQSFLDENHHAKRQSLGFGLLLRREACGSLFYS